VLDVNDFEPASRIGPSATCQTTSGLGRTVRSAKPETITTARFVRRRTGLFCEKIFGPTKDLGVLLRQVQAALASAGIICERCGVEVTRSKVRRDGWPHRAGRFGRAHLVPAWYLARGSPTCSMGTEAREELKAKQLEKVIYFAAYLVTHVDEERRHADLPNLRPSSTPKLAR